jgi:hypothetical protein
MRYDITQSECTEPYRRSVDFNLEGETFVTVEQELRSPVDLKPRSPHISWRASGYVAVDKDYAEAMAIALKQASELARQWEEETVSQAA